MLNRWVEVDHRACTLDAEGIGSILFWPLAQGVLTNRYLGGIPTDAARPRPAPSIRSLTTPALEKVHTLNAIAKPRGQSLAQMALVWALRDRRVTSALIGASRPEQVGDAVIGKFTFTADELKEIDRHAVDAEINLWARSAELAQ